MINKKHLIGALAFLFAVCFIASAAVIDNSQTLNNDTEHSLSAQTYTVTLNANGGSCSQSTLTAASGESVSLPTPTKPGYRFDGWYVGTDETSIYNELEQAINSSGNGDLPYEWRHLETFTVVRNVTLTAMYSEIFTITYDANGGIGRQVDTVYKGIFSIGNDPFFNLSDGSKFSREGYHIIGWASGSPSGTVYNLGMLRPAGGTTTYYAVWESNSVTQYRLSFNANGGTGSIDDILVDAGSMYILPKNQFTRDGYKLAGWALGSTSGAQYQAGGYFVPSSDCVFYAIWVANSVTQYTISFNANGGTGSIDNILVDVSDPRCVLPSSGFTKDNQILVGWALNSPDGITYALGSYYGPSADATFYAIWDVNQCSVTFDNNGGSGRINTMLVAEGDSILLPDENSGITKEGYHLIGWAVDFPNGIVSNLEASFTVGSNTIFYAVWEIDTYTIHFNANGGSIVSEIDTDMGTIAVVNNQISVPYGTKISSPYSTKDFHALYRWTDETGVTFDFEKIVSSDLTLTAEWKQHFTVSVEQNKVTVTIDPFWTGYAHKIVWGDNEENEIETMSATHAYASATEYSIRVTSTTWEKDLKQSEGKVTVVDVPTITVTFESNGGSNLDSIAVADGTKIIKPADPSKEGYVFGGWYIDEGLTNEFDFNSTVSEDITLYAKWNEPSSNWTLVIIIIIIVIIIIILLMWRPWE